MSGLPIEYAARMQKMLGGEWEDYLASLDGDPVQSIRINTRKWTPDEADARFPEFADQVPWVPEGRYVPAGCRPAKHPAYYAGLYYIQEASAMTPGDVLPLKAGGRVLDLCAAPGGKSTQLAARMASVSRRENGSGKNGVLYANDISASRAQALLKNLEMAGMPDLFVTAENPGKLAEQFPGYFDSILVDAPCSGEGMTRRDSAMWKDWESRGPAYYRPVQAEILDQAAVMAAPGAYLLYSTCTFSQEENEDNIDAFLGRHPDFHLIPIRMRDGFSEGFLPGTVRLWPHKIRGEGHFLALLQKDGIPDQAIPDNVVPDYAIPDNSIQAREIPKKESCSGRKTGKHRSRAGNGETLLPERFLEEYHLPWENYRLSSREGKVYAVPSGETVRPGIHYLRTGLYLGEWKRQPAFQPSQALAMALSPETAENRISFSWEDDRTVHYLKCETVDACGAEIHGEDGWTLVCLDRYPLGWAVRNSTRMKNKYNPGWRWV